MGKATKMLDNKKTGRVADELRSNIERGTKLSVISAYFTIYAYEALKKELNKVDSFRLLLTDPSFSTQDNEEQKEFYISHDLNKSISGNEFEIKLKNEMKQASISKECADWLRKKSDVRVLKTQNLAQPRLIYAENTDPEDCMCINGSADFTTDGLGITPSNRIDYNTCVYGKENTEMYVRMFDEIWNNPEAVKDIKTELLEHMQTLYKENTPEFIYHKLQLQLEQ